MDNVGADALHMVTRDSKGDRMSPVSDGAQGMTIQSGGRQRPLERRHGEAHPPSILEVNKALIGPGVDKSWNGECLTLPGEGDRESGNTGAGLGCSGETANPKTPSGGNYTPWWPGSGHLGEQNGTGANTVC